MTSGHTVTTTAADVHVEVRLGDQLLAETEHPVVLEETGLPTRYYLPKQDVRMDLLIPTTFHTQCPFKGTASYWSVEVDGIVHDGIAWAYESPIEAAEDITGMLCFYPDQVEMAVGG